LTVASLDQLGRFGLPSSPPAYDATLRIGIDQQHPFTLGLG
jgi:hypothetical protein